MKSMKANAFLNGFRNVLNLLFPLITFPYISRVLGVESIGKYNFSNSVVSYFLLIAGLGISTYAIREGSQYRNEPELFNKFVSEVFTINLIATILSYCLLFFCVIVVDKLKEYKIFILVFSLQIVLTTIGVEWIYSIYEDYRYITVRSICFKVLSILMMFAFVKDANDTLNYVLITVIASVGSNTLNFFHIKKYCKLSLERRSSLLKKHLKPIFIIFASNIAIIIYTSSDITMLGLIKNDYVVGIYSISVKIYNILKTLLSAVLIVSIPRLSVLSGRKETKKFTETVQMVIDAISIILIPTIVGVFLYSEQIVLLIAGKEYLQAETSLRLLCAALLVCIYGWIYNQCILIPHKQEKIVLVATALSAAINIILNFLLMPGWGEKAAAFSTIIAELTMFVFCGIYAKRECYVRIINKNMFSVVAGCVGMCVYYLFIKDTLNTQIALLFINIIVSFLLYIGIAFMCKNDLLLLFLKKKKWRIKS